jgi:uncharacterized protein (TIGR03435 family)
MNRALLLAAPVLLWAVAEAFAQPAPAGPAFEVATVKRSPPFDMNLFFSGKAHTGVKIDKAYADFGGSSLASLIAYAYRVKDYQVSGQEWMEAAHFDVLGKLPEGASKDSVPEMMQALLAERFHLKLRAVSKDLSVYALVLREGGSKLLPKPADYKPEYGPKSGPAGLNDLSPTTMENYVGVLSHSAERPVVDQTGLSGEYMLPVLSALQAASARYAGAVARQREARVGHDALADAIQAIADEAPGVSSVLPKELKLESRKIPMTVLMIDHADETPTAN